MTNVAFHWGTYDLLATRDDVSAARPADDDPDPSGLGQSVIGARTHRSRILRPAIRRGYLEGGANQGGNRRGDDPFIEVDWDTALDLAASALQSTIRQHGNKAIFAGSYGWASAGRFHHAQSQIHRFLNLAGGYVASRNSYSHGAMAVISPHVIGPIFDVFAEMPTWEEIAAHGALVIAFGGISPKNAQLSPGGVGRHTAKQAQQRCKEAGVRFVNVSPDRSDCGPWLDAEWVPLRPNTDTAFMLGMAHRMESQGCTDQDFLSRCCVGYPAFRAYLLGESDGVPKTADWAGVICGVDPDVIRRLADEASSACSLITTSWSLQRAQHGEQPYWMSLVLAAMSGSMGRLGGGFGSGYGAIHAFGQAPRIGRVAGLSLGRNAVTDFVPVARISDMLLNPGGSYQYDGQHRTYPDIRVVYWAGGNPFHHQQDLRKLRQAWQVPETVIVHDSWWTATARHADIVFPAAASFERNDIAAGMQEPLLVASKQAFAPYAEARSDYAIFTGLAARLGIAEAFTEGRDEMGWVRALYNESSQACAADGIVLPDFEKFWEDGAVPLPQRTREQGHLARFRANPAAAPLPTRSGRIEIFSEAVAAHATPDCPGHPAWLEPREWLGAADAVPGALHLLSNQPTGRLHSQLDFGRASTDGKINGLEVLRMHPADAAVRGIADGQTVRVRNTRGAFCAAARLTQELRPGVISIPTGAWFAPADGGEDVLCTHGNPNAVTLDVGTSLLAQGSSANTCLVVVEPFEAREDGTRVDPFAPPAFVRAANDATSGSLVNVFESDG